MIKRWHLHLAAASALFLSGWTLRGELDPPAKQVPRVTGIGGIFFKSRDPEALKAWYSKHFGMTMNEYGALMEFHTGPSPKALGYLQWSPFSERTKYFAPSAKDFMINYRVTGIDELVAQLRRDSVMVLDSIERVEYGAFVHLMDPEGNKIELWDPEDSVFTRLYGNSTVK
jgi:predicted enzyme related to lactoylglutathione lyase